MNTDLQIVDYDADGNETATLIIHIPLAKIKSSISANLTAGKIWPASLVLSHFILHHRAWLQGKRIWEWGSGMAIPSLVALKSCKVQGIVLQELNIAALLEMQKVIFSDNNLPITAPSFCQVPLKWGDLPTENIDHIDLFLAADCLYERNDFADLVASAAVLMSRNGGAHWIMCYQDRNLLYSIEELFEYWHLKADLIPLSSFNFDPQRIRLNKTLVDDFPAAQVCDTTLYVLEICNKDDKFIFC